MSPASLTGTPQKTNTMSCCVVSLGFLQPFCKFSLRPLCLVNFLIEKQRRRLLKNACVSNAMGAADARAASTPNFSKMCLTQIMLLNSTTM